MIIIIIMINNNNNNDNSNAVLIKSTKYAKSKYFLLPDVPRKRMGLLKRKKNVFYLLIKIPNLNHLCFFQGVKNCANFKRFTFWLSRY